MGRSGYSEGGDLNNWDLIRWRGQVASAIRGKRGQAFLKELLAALDALPEKRLVENELEAHGEVCTLGALGKARGIDMAKIDPEDRSTVAGTFGIAEPMAAEIMFENDGDFWWGNETPEQRFDRMRRWVVASIKSPNPLSSPHDTQAERSSDVGTKT